MGPKWLTTSEQWPKWQPSSHTHLLAAAATAGEFVPAETLKNEVGLHQIIHLEHHSSLSKLLAVTAYVFRFVANLKTGSKSQQGVLSPSELHSSRIKNCQQETYSKEIANIRSHHSGTNCLPLARQLHLFLDKDGYLQCGGRLRNAPVSDTTKFPYLLPAKHHFSSLVITDTHVKLFHAGSGSTLTTLRQEQWILSARQHIKTLLI